jgi:hypothetical protein
MGLSWASSIRPWSCAAPSLLRARELVGSDGRLQVIIITAAEANGRAAWVEVVCRKQIL